MKKLFVLCLLSFVFCMGVEVLAYTQVDVSNANYLADEGIIVKQSTTAGYRLDSTITRAELMGIALKLKWVTLPNYQCKWYYSDVRNNDWVCRAVEIGADNGLVTRANTRFRAQDNITRAEALAILMRAGEIDIPSGATVSVSPISDKDIWDWWDMVFYAGLIKIIANPNVDKLPGDIRPFYFYPNRAATRAEVFGFAKNILEYKATISNETAQ